jgi:hypothetical protein
VTGFPATERRGRVGLARALVVVGCVLALVASIGLWARQQLLDTDQWVTTSADVLSEPAVQAELSRYVAAELTSPGEERTHTADFIRRVLAAPLVTQLWSSANRTTHERFVAVVNGDASSGEDLVLDLHPMILELAQLVAASSDVPADSGRIVVLESDQLDTVRTASDVLDTVSWWALGLTLAAFAGALLLAPGRRAGIVAMIGGGLALVGVLLVAFRAGAGSVVAHEVARRTGAGDAASATWSVATTLLLHIAVGLLIAGATLAVMGVLARPRRGAL